MFHLPSVTRRQGFVNAIFKNDSDDPECPVNKQQSQARTTTPTAATSTGIVGGHGKEEILKHLADEAEAFNVLVGRLAFLDNPIVVFVRLDEAQNLGDLTEAELPSRFLFLALGPETDEIDYFQIGRSISVIMATMVSKF